MEASSAPWRMNYLRNRAVSSDVTANRWPVLLHPQKNTTYIVTHTHTQTHIHSLTPTHVHTLTHADTYTHAHTYTHPSSFCPSSCPLLTLSFGPIPIQPRDPTEGLWLLPPLSISGAPSFLEKGIHTTVIQHVWLWTSYSSHWSWGRGTGHLRTSLGQEEATCPQPER